MDLYIKVPKEDIVSGRVPSTLGPLSGVRGLDLKETDLFRERAAIHEIGDAYYVYTRIFDKPLQNRLYEQSTEEEALIQEFIDRYMLETLTVRAFAELIGQEGE